MYEIYVHYICIILYTIKTINSHMVHWQCPSTTNFCTLVRVSVVLVLFTYLIRFLNLSIKVVPHRQLERTKLPI